MGGGHKEKEVGHCVGMGTGPSLWLQQGAVRFAADFGTARRHESRVCVCVCVCVCVLRSIDP